MMSSKSFIDVLFILLLGTLVLLTHSVRLGAVDTVVAKLGGGGISPVRADEVQVVVIGADELRFNGRTAARVEDLVTRLAPGKAVLLITADRRVRHHRVMETWFALRHRGIDVKLGAERAADGSDGR